MKKIFFLFVLNFILFSCKKQDKIQQEVEQKQLTLEVERYDQAFFNTKPEDLQKLKAKYPYFFPKNIDQAALLQKMQDPLWRELYKEVQKKYNNFDQQKENIERLFKYLQYYYPKTQAPKIITIIQEMDPEYKVIYSPEKNLLIVSLELYLGSQHKFYEFPEFMKKNFEPSQIMPDIVDAIATNKVKPPTDRDFLSQMIYAGKKLYLKDALLPTTSDHDKIGYTTQELQWCQANQENIWRFMIEEKLLYDTNPMWVTKLIAPGPFSKFGLDSDKQTPPRVATWIGWQIVRAYMDNNKTSLPELMNIDAKEIFQKSKYKPTKQ